MTIPNTTPPEVERAREHLANELAADSGAGWADAYRPGSPGCHELLDRASMLAEMLERHLVAHPACVANPARAALVERAARGVRELSRQVGAEHVGADQPVEK